MAGGSDTSGDGSPALRYVAAGVALAAITGAGLLWRFSDPAFPTPSQDIVVISAQPATIVPPPADPVVAHGTVINYELLGIAGGTALIAPHGEMPRAYRVGDRIGAALTLIEIRRGSVRLQDGDRVTRLSLPPRLGGSAEPVPPGKEGLMPEPQPPSGEASGAIVAQRLAEANGAASPSADNDPAR